ncbi:hypothetical protein SARC_03423 [Sphaeroforma arctica JP610]|uniref:FAD-binding PCMH-type domain-containing protein n=1 Tax=Sphaeroforma arctica JP610 TaxID=667725 RepID=A0A0L0G7X4_9EUKA|nr:hypothetical protein SARC_03423 [Sphaeroforma arctica JP610]KNC84343.1 hypothetical protein SARC_03423 [Sphaeroforma arctica JP610]|eukprot:XP_014158245.1 hypothetical protein SARC_03423 [Sphaeroforma arctica JP610]
MGAELPLAFDLPLNNEDAQDVVRTLARNNISTRIQSGTHTYSNESVQGELGVTISTALMKTLHIDSDQKLVHVGVGCTLGEMYDLAHANGYIFIGGTHASTGVAGYTLGGGQSTQSRFYGLAVDHVIEFQFVAPDGQILVVREDGPYNVLFWALRGGGNSNFGLITTFLFRLHHRSVFPDVTEGTFYFNIANDKNLTADMLNS